MALLKRISEAEMQKMEEVDQLFNYIPEIPEEHFLEISQFILLPAINEEALQQVTDNNNNVQSEQRYSEYKEQENCTPHFQ